MSISLRQTLARGRRPSSGLSVGRRHEQRHQHNEAARTLRPLRHGQRHHGRDEELLQLRQIGEQRPASWRVQLRSMAQQTTESAQTHAANSFNLTALQRHSLASMINPHVHASTFNRLTMSHYLLSSQWKASQENKTQPQLLAMHVLVSVVAGRQNQSHQALRGEQERDGLPAAQPVARRVTSSQCIQT